ncbi:DUF3376 domain-containing protein [Streptomyces sp. NPDC048349]|uniref:DUF3376 domain-containing protein n=1 Tax=Streptomyces sp. NPDC048349 TaxID=3155486 RepID=UPI00341F6E97
MNATAQGTSSSELRLALAMRGGVSLAVWMGGACCETAALRRAADPAPGPGEQPEPETAVYRSLLRSCRYTDVDIDVVVGTSAGGLNGVLLACHLVYGMPFGAGVRDVWLRLGDLEGLLRRSTPFHVPDSLMRGDEVFYTELRRSLDALLADAPEPRRPVGSLRLILTATRLRPRRDWVRPTRGVPLLVGRSNAYFRFRHRAPLTDFPSGGAARKAALDRLAFAARTTSSFPGAFEPGRLYVGGAPPPADRSAPVDLRGVSSETGYPDGPDGCVELVDGGLLDNIPVAWAVRAIAGAPATQKTDRWLLFLQPVPPSPPKPEPPGSRRVTRLVRMAVKSLTVKTGAESLRDDALELRATEAAAQHARAVTGALPPNLSALEFAAAARMGAYRRTVGTGEAKRLVRLLEDPADVTGPDPLPLPAGPGPLEPLDASPGEGSVSLFARLCAAGGSMTLPDVSGPLPCPGRSPLALARTVRLLMDWLRAYEARTPAEDVDAQAMAECRARLYAYRFAVATLIAARDRLLLRTYAAALGGGALPARATGPLYEATALLGEFMPEVPEAGADPAEWRAWSGSLAAALDRASAAPAQARSGQWPEGLYRELWERAGELGRRLGRVMTPATVDGYQALHEAAAGDGPQMRDALAAAEVLLGPLRPDPLAEASDIAFHTMSAANTSWATREVLRDVDPESPKDMVAAKLSGNQLANFAAFLSARWRLSDWTWGRLDAAASLVSVVATDERLAAAFGGDDPGDPDYPDDEELGALVADSVPEPALFKELYHKALVSLPETGRWDRVRDTLTALRQREILDQELPLIAALHAKGIRAGNRPDIPEPRPLTTPADVDRAMDAFRAIGAEKVGALVRARDPRRAALRTGLLAWPALQPARGLRARLVQGALGLAKPLLCLVPVTAVLAPLPALCAAALMWTAVAFSTGQWSSLPGHVPLAVLTALSLAAWVWPGLRAAWQRWPAVVVLTALPALALVLLHGVPEDSVHGWPLTPLVGAACALAAGALLYVGTDPAHRWRGVLAALVAGAVAALVQFGRDGLGGWWAALIVYAVLFVVTAVHPWLYAEPADTEPQARPSARVNR